MRAIIAILVIAVIILASALAFVAGRQSSNAYISGTFSPVIPVSQNAQTRNAPVSGFVPSAPAPTKPATSATKPSEPPRLAWGSCEFGGKRWDLGWDSNKGVLYMDNFLAQAKEANKSQPISCNLTAYAPGTLKVFGNNDPFGRTGGEFRSFTFPVNDPSLGFSWVR